MWLIELGAATPPPRDCSENRFAGLLFPARVDCGEMVRPLLSDVGAAGCSSFLL